MFNGLRRMWRMFGKPIEERDYHDSFNDCVHHWNWSKNGQCPQCAREVVRAINWSCIKKEEDYERLKPVIDASKRKV